MISCSSDIKQQILNSFTNNESERTFKNFYEKINPPTLEILKDALAELLKENKIKAIYRVYSSYGDGLKDFKKFNEIPKIMEDSSQDPPIEFNVGLSNIEVIFTVL